MSNIPPSILAKCGRDLHRKPNHPIQIIAKLVTDYFATLERDFEVFDDLDHKVSTVNNFDRLLIPSDHPARSKSDTYYFDDETVLRTHTSAHQTELLEDGHTSFFVVGDVYRKDEIDRTHYPVFHQIEGVHIFEDDLSEEDMTKDLIDVLKGLCGALFPDCEVRTADDYFPFTHPSFEIEVLHKGEWIEILGCGIVQPLIIKSCVMENRKLMRTNGDLKKGWAFGIGLDRLAMILFKIPDIRLLWVDDPKFLSQFEDGKITQFVSYSSLDPITKDISFWIPEEQIEIEDVTATKTIQNTVESEKYREHYYWKSENDAMDLIRDTANEHYPDIIESVVLFDQFEHPKTNKLSRAYRFKFSVSDPNMNNSSEFNRICNELHTKIAHVLTENLGVTIR